MKRVRNYRVRRPVAGIMGAICLLGWNAPAAAAFQKPQPRRALKTQTPDAEQRREIDAQQRAAAARPERRTLSEKEMGGIRGRGIYRNPSFNGVLPWQRSLRDVNLCNGNLFKSFTDIQVSPARGAGLAWQRSYNSNDARIGPFGIGWTHAYDIRMEEAGNNQVPRTDFFGGKHAYHRDADGLYTPPAYLHDELSSDYDQFLADGPAEVLSDDQKGMDGTVKHFTSGGTDADSSPSSERVIDYIEDRHGNRTNFTYGTTINLPGGGTRKLLTTVTDPSGRYLNITWSNLGTQMQPAYRITQAAGPYDGSNNPIYTTTYEYNSDLNLWKVHQDPNGLNRVTTYTYTTYDDGQNNTETGLLASIADPLGHTVSYQYAADDGFGLPLGAGTVWVTGVSEPGSGGAHTWSIDADPYSSSGFTVSCSSNGGLFTSLVVDAQLRKVYYGFAGPNGPTYDLYYDSGYDSANNLTRQEVDGAGGRVEALSTYGPHGNVLTQAYENFNGATTTTYYDASKYFQKASVTDPNGQTTTFDYFDNADPSVGKRGEVKWVRDARYSTTGQQFEFTYNSYGQKLTETNLNDVVTEYTYGDTWGNLTQVVQDPGMGHLNRTTTTSYDAAGRVLSSTDPKSQTSSFTYNNAGQPLTATLPGENLSYSYGTNGRTESVTDGRGTTTLAYDTGNDWVASVTDPVTGAISYTYGLAGQRLTVGLPGGGTWTYEYAETSTAGKWQSLMAKDDPNSVSPKLLSVEDDQGRVVEYDTDHLGTLKTVRNNQTYTGGTLTAYQQATYTYDGNGSETRRRLAQVANTYHSRNMMGQWQSQVLVQNNYTTDNAGNRLTNQISDNSGPIRTEEYGYDALSRLTSVDYDDGETQAYTFDAMGNRLTRSVNGTSTSYTYNAVNMLLTRGANNYTNDSNGNTLTGGGRTNTWDGQNRLTQCVYNSATTTHTYGSDRLRRRTVEGSNTTDYVLDGQEVVRTLLNNVVDKTYLHGVRGPEYERTGANAPVWYLYDGLGSVLGTVDGTGNLVSTRKYDVYGAIRGTTGPGGTKHKYVGSLGHPSEDETGLVYMRARCYDPVTGRFISQDPELSGTNWFNYANSNPVRYVDRNGCVASETWGDYGLAMSHAASAVAFAAMSIKGGGALFSLVAVELALTAVYHFAKALGDLNLKMEHFAVIGTTTTLGGYYGSAFWTNMIVKTLEGTTAMSKSIIQGGFVLSCAITAHALAVTGAIIGTELHD